LQEKPVIEIGSRDLGLKTIYIMYKILKSVKFHETISLRFAQLNWKTELTENSDFCLFAANEKLKRQTSLCLLQTEMENGSLLSLAGK
jgi:hypothetical protein